MAPIMSLSGGKVYSSTVELYDDRLMVKRFWQRAEEIPLKNIVRISDISPPSNTLPGIMEITSKDDDYHFRMVPINISTTGYYDVEKLREKLVERIKAVSPGFKDHIDPFMKLEGPNFSNNVIELYEDRLTVKSQQSDTYVISIKTLVGLRPTPPAFMTMGMLFFNIKDDKGRVRESRALYFNKNGADDIEKLRRMMDDLMKGIRPQPQAQVSKGTQASPSMGELEKLADFKARGIITEEEFQAKKQQLLFGNGGGPVLREKETVIKEIVKIPCAYCGLLVDITSSKCPGCGAPFNRR